jgi:autophagy-related protein 13
MYGQDNPHLPWGSPQRRRVTGGNEVDSQTKRHSTGMNYFGLETSEPSGATGGVIQFSRPGGHVRSESVGTTAVGIMGEGNARAVGEKSQRDKVNQIVQAFFWKAAMVIIQSRMSVAPLLSPRSQERKTNKWVGILPTYSAAGLLVLTRMTLVQY